MKKMIFSLLAIAAMTSCTTTSEDEIDPNAPVEIKMQASIGVTARGAVEELSDATASDFGFLRADGAENATVGSLTWGSTLLSTTVANDGTINFTIPQFYDIDETQYAYFIGVYPKSALTESSNNFNQSIVKDGQQDIMYATMQGGNRKTVAITSTFEHKLSQLKFKFAKSDDPELSSLGDVKSIKIKGIKLPKSINFKTGEISYETTPIEDGITISITNATYGSAKEATEVVMVQPETNELTADITLSDGKTYSNIKLNVTTVEGTAHTITLKFQKKEVSSSAVISPWKTADAGETPVM